MASALATLVRAADLRDRLGRRARAVVTAYALPAILDQWNALVESVLPAPIPDALRS